MNDAYWLPVIFIGLMGLAILIYSILDGYDLGVGILLPSNDQAESDRDTMIASIGPFWDANETWLVLAVGIMLIAFPEAHSIVFFHLYIPSALMLIGLILRGVAFDFRAKAGINHKLAWDRCFKAGSWLTSLSQGYMLGLFVVGFDTSMLATFFCLLSAICVTAAYRYIGACWLVLKTEGELQAKSIAHAKNSGRLALIGVISVCLVNTLVNEAVFDRWFAGSLNLLLFILPIVCFFAFFYNDRLLGSGEKVIKQCWLPMVLTIVIFICCFVALGASFFPYIIPNQITVWDAASATESLQFIFKGAAIVVPIIVAYTAYSYWVFRGKATDLRYH